MRLSVRLEGRYPENGPSYTVATGCEVGGSLGQLPALARTIEETLRPAPTEVIEEWLAELSVLVARREGDEFTEELRVTAYASRLAAYPADVVREVLLARVWKFWPTWEELHRACESLATPRRHMLAACRQQPVPEEPRPTQERVTPEAAARILEAAGFTPRRFAAIENGRRMPRPGSLVHEVSEPTPEPPMSPEDVTAMCHRIASRLYTPEERARMSYLRPREPEWIPDDAPGEARTGP